MEAQMMVVLSEGRSDMCSPLDQYCPQIAPESEVVHGLARIPKRQLAHRVSLRLLKRNLVSIPAGCSIEDFMVHRGKPPESVAAISTAKKELTLAELRDASFKSQEKKLEQTTLDGSRLHFDHLSRILGTRRSIPTLMRQDLQKYVDKRSEEWIDPNSYRRKRREKLVTTPRRKFKIPRPPKLEPPDKPLRHPSAATIKKEIISLRTAWNWARRHLGLAEEFPGTGLDYAKVEQSLPFMTWDEAEARMAAGDDPEKVWDGVYLRPAEIAELLEWVKGRPVSPWVYPMFAFATHTGARRSEIVRALPSDRTGGRGAARRRRRIGPTVAR
jgi:integrase